ncbi:hypothetical protein [Bacillus sp. RIT 809]|nr:hypothetical protein [Bacillus sp. RIT 809]MBM6646884.1 hypothetical protein [Bacillus sp. RIT 809]
MYKFVKGILDGDADQEKEYKELMGKYSKIIYYSGELGAIFNVTFAEKDG